MFQLANEEFENLKSQIVISSWGGARRARPYAFTEQGVAILSSVLRSKRSVQVNIEIMRAFVRLRQLAAPTWSCYFQFSQVAFLFTKYNLDYPMFWIWFLAVAWANYSEALGYCLVSLSWHGA